MMKWIVIASTAALILTLYRSSGAEWHCAHDAECAAFRRIKAYTDANNTEPFSEIPLEVFLRLWGRETLDFSNVGLSITPGADGCTHLSKTLVSYGLLFVPISAEELELTRCSGNIVSVRYVQVMP
jgi:hypothetical protein